MVMVTGIDIFVEVVGDGVSLLGIAEEASSIIWSDIPLSQLCFPKV